MLRKLGLALALLALVSPAAADWPMFQADSANSGSQPEPLRNATNLWWSWSGETATHIEAQPIVAEGAVIVADWDGKVTALDIGSGLPRWSYDMGDKVVSTPAASLGWVFVADIKGDLVALDLRDGTEMATAQVGATRAPVTIHEGKVFLGNEAGEMTAWTATTLDELWRFDVATVQDELVWNNTTKEFDCAGDGHPARPIRSAAAVHQGRVYFASMNHHVYAVDERGTPEGDTLIRWTHRTDDIILASPVIDVQNGALFMASYDETVRRLPTSAGGTPNLCFGVNPAAAWTFQVPGAVDTSKVHSTPAFDGARLYFGTNNGNVYAISAVTGAQTWSLATGGPVLANPIVANGTVVIGSDDGMLRWIHAATGKVTGSWQAGAPIKTGVALHNETIIVATEDGVVSRIGGPLPAQADLFVERIMADQQALTIFIRNQGDKGSTPTTAQVWINGTLAATYEIPALAPGEAYTVVHEGPFEPGLLMFEIVLDPENTLYEKGKENNIHTDSAFIVDEASLEDPGPSTVAKDQGMPWWVWLIIGSVVVLGGGGAGGFLWWKKRGKTEAKSLLELEEDEDEEGPSEPALSASGPDHVPEADAEIGEPEEAEASTPAPDEADGDERYEEDLPDFEETGEAPEPDMDDPFGDQL